MLRRSLAVAFASLLLATSCASPAPATPSASPAPPAATEPCGSGGIVQSSIQTAAPTTAPATAATAPAPTAAISATPATAATPTATPRPAPTTDRVGFPDDYLAKFKFAYVYDRQDAKSVSYVCFNEVAATLKQGQAFPYGSILVFESWRPKEDAQGNLIKDANGHMIRSTLNAIFVGRKEKGFGEAYKESRSGEWEWVAYRADKSFQTPPQGSFTCAACHSAGSTPERDWTFRAWTLPFTPTRWAQAPLPGANEVSLNRMAFFPNVLTVKVGTTVRWINSVVDQIDHQIGANDGSFGSSKLKPGDSFSQSFTKAGTYLYFCPLHPEQMRARVEVKD
jgi:plastocyanin